MSCSTCSNNTTGVPNGCKSNGSCGNGGCNKLTVFDWLANMQLPSGQKIFNIVEVQFKNERKEYFKNEKGLSLFGGDIVCVQGTSGHDVGTVTLTGELVKLQLNKRKIKDTKTLPVIYRKAGDSDIVKWHEARELENEVKPKARKIAIELKLDMKISDIEYQGDKSKATFYYTADSRVDFRELIKRFASTFNTRVEMKQIGMRQEAGKLGGIGSCGRELCCSTWLTDFRSVNTSAARYQQLSLNPQKLAGQCGKLKCCLNFELDAYMEQMKTFPDTRIDLKTLTGSARHQKTDVFKRMMWYSVLDKNGVSDFIPMTVERVSEVIEMNKAGEKPQSLKDFMVVETPLVEEKENYNSVVGQDSLTRFDNNFKKKVKSKKKGNFKGKPKGPSSNNTNKKQVNNNNNIK
jgi:cell fate regulator YaaT (PSP1 superfamily)